jgi:Flp pilus assembly protein TadB
VNDNFVLPSTFVLTLLLMVGLFFFIRASTKERTEQLEFVSDELEESLLEKLEKHFVQRAYKVAAVNAEREEVIFQGTLRPSWFLAIFLSILAALGFLCLALVLSFLYPSLTLLFLSAIATSPLAGVFYWRGAKRVESVKIVFQTRSPIGESPQTIATVTAHRDELAQLKQALSTWKIISLEGA